MALPTRVNRALDLPFVPLDSMHREFDQMLNRFFGGRAENNGYSLTPYGVDIWEDADHIYVEAELPGFQKEDVDITMENSTLTIAAERKAESKQENQGDWLLNERRYARFLRSFTLPPTVDEGSVQAKLQDGVLKITLNKREETKPRKVQVS